MSLTIGIVGLPNVGKSTLFNALTKNDVLAANYPFATIEPNVGVVGVPDPRLTKLAEIFGSQRILPATVDFVDIAGIVRGASEGEGLGNKFLANIRESDAICQVIRAFKDENVVHVDGKVSPKDDIETINTELILADLQTIEKVLPRLQKESRIKKDVAPKVKAVEEAKDILEKGDTLFSQGIVQGTERAELLHDLHLLTTKPFLYVFNVDEDELTDEDFKNEQRELVAPAEAIFLNAKLEADLAELDEDEALELLQSVGQEEPGLATLAHVGFRTLGLQTYLTARPQGIPRLDHQEGRHRPRGRRCHPHRLPEGLHQGGGHLLRRPGRDRLGRGGPREGQGADGGQGVRDAGRGCGGVPLQCVIGSSLSARRFVHRSGSEGRLVRAGLCVSRHTVRGRASSPG